MIRVPCEMSDSSARAHDLPAPVATYLARALGPVPRRIVSVQMQQTGTLRVGATGSRWLHFRAQHEVTPQLRLFCWSARVRLAPLIWLQVRDAYSAGVAEGRVHLWSRLPLLAERDLPELNAGALQRFLAETAWYPGALLPTAGVRWRAIDPHTAMATLQDSGLTVSMEFRFDAAGDLRVVHTESRWRRVGKRFQACGWEGRFGDYRSCQGLRVPFEAEAGWYAEGRLVPVWRGDVTDLEYRFEPLP